MAGELLATPWRVPDPEEPGLRAGETTLTQEVPADPRLRSDLDELAGQTLADL